VALAFWLMIVFETAFKEDDFELTIHDIVMQLLKVPLHPMQMSLGVAQGANLPVHIF